MKIIDIKKIEFYKTAKAFCNNIISLEFNFTYAEKPCLFADYVTDLAFERVAIILSVDLQKVEEIYLFNEEVESVEKLIGAELKCSSLELFPRTLFNGYFMSDLFYKDPKDFISDFVLEPIYIHKQYVIYRQSGRLKIADKNKVNSTYSDVLKLPLMDDLEKQIVHTLKGYNVSLIPYDICRLINSYRRLKLNINNDEMCYWEGYEND